MKRRVLVALLVTVAVIGGLLAFFPVQWVLLLIALVALITAQVILLRRHTTVLPYPPGTSRAPGESAPPRTPAQPAPSAGESSPEAMPGAEVYSRFREHLESMERGASRAAAEVRAAPADVPAEAVTDQVELSAAARSQPGPATSNAPARPARAGSASAPVAPPLRKRSAGRAQDEGEEPDLFADLRPALAVSRAGPSRPGSPAPSGSIPGALRAPATDEVGQALARAREPQQIQEEGAALIRIAQDALDENNLPRAKAVLEQYESLLAEAPSLATWQAARAQLQLAAREDRAAAIAPAFQAMLDRGYAPKAEELEAELDPLLESLAPERRAPVKVALLLKALGPFRQAGDREAMDRIYGRIEAAQEAAGDERKLIQLYKNHLAIKEALGDHAGRLSLIDKIGNRYYQLGDTAPAKEFYEMGMKLRAELEQARVASGGASEPSGATPPGDGPSSEEETGGG